MAVVLVQCLTIFMCIACGYEVAQSEISSYHYGVDIDNQEGADVQATDSGTVLSVTPFKRGEGQITVSNIDGSESMYVYVKPFVEVGQRVHAGQKIGITDTNGFEVKNIIHYGFRPSPGALFVDPMSHLPQKEKE
ncbi:M23 family metallopeptidase [Fundidesulfovibrio terrae]|uniref:M23 family metallopeptidase n=1 Tax=Fundidesulfovibrio terrae TaxID=2922866 RepID=UPI001FAF3D79|nr:M23 family metallopeptidase [Fundidesulfovibrio terrae]